MKKQTFKLVLAVCVLILVAFTASAVAHEDEDHGASSDTKSKKHQQWEEYKKRKQEETSDKKKEIVADKKGKTEVRKFQLKKDVCEDRKDTLQAKVPRLGKGAANLQEVFDKVYERVQNFYADEQLNVANYEELKAAVDTAQAEAEAAVDAAKDYKLEIDCESSELAEQLNEYREKVKAAKQALKDYRTTLVTLIKAVKEAALEASNG